MKVIVYEKKTGKALSVEPIDARELISTGFYTDEKPDKQKPKRRQSEAKID